MAAYCAASSSWCKAKPTVRNSAKISNPSKVQPRLEAINTRHWSPFSERYHEVFEAGVFRLDRFDAVDDLVRRAAEPRLLLHPFAQARDRRRRTRGAPGAALLVGVADEAERREPFVALVMRRFEAADRLFLA